ncbi:uncharacterized protein LOC125818545 [Solanum verrucosum]|uniref:uncharacterized protein LOC125818545 n=1 Tax=Solanum verrucosum TaxID=315347 RepID=UPI0020CFEA3E|nr:uncharacterized protein LOC125818545 [Solanum verrucosum]
MERKALALADSGIMPVSKNEEPGVIAWQSSNSSSLLPYKKRWYSLLYPHAPIHPSRYVGDLVKPALAENLVGQEAIGTAKVSVKNEVVPKQGESHSKLELPADSGHIDKGKQVVGASEQEFHFPISSIHPALRHKSRNVLRVSLGSTLRGFDSSVLQSKSEPVEEALVQANTVDLKELNVCSDKVEASVSASMQIEDHMVYKKTQDTHNLVASGEGSANDGEKISISAGTEEECMRYVREDEECEDGEIREPLVQSIAEDPNAKGMDSGKNNESSSKNVQNVAVFRPVTGSSLPSRSGRERYFYTEEEKFHLQRNRDEIYGYGPKFVRDRFQDRPFGRSRGNFMRGRGRGWGWGRGQGRYSGRDFESYDNRHKHTAAFWESANECKDYDNRLDGGAIASSRRRDPLNDPLHSFQHPPAHGLSPNGREDAAMMDISPRRCPGEDGSAYVGVQHSRPDHHFGQGDNTKFTAMQRSGFPRMWSKSPVRSRTWSLPPRTLTEGLNGRQNLSQHRSPVMYREDRMRSSSQTSFTEEAIAPQRRDRPSYTARQNDMRDVDDVEEYGHPRSLSSRGSPPDQKRADGDGQMRNVKEQEGGNVRPRHEEEFGGSRLKKRRF